MKICKIKNSNLDTICAISTPIGINGIGIVRISGKKSVQITKKITNLKILKPRFAHLANIFDENEKIETGIVIFFKNPKSFTGEDLVEFQVHGNNYILNKILSILIKNGARLAEPGEFSKRAFLNGKIDLVQAEAIASLIHSSTDFAIKKSFENLSGGISKKALIWKEKILKFLAETEANIDFYDTEDLPFFNIPKNKVILDEILIEIEKLLKSFKVGKILEHGAKIVLAGLPNSGKSSLFNFLLGKEKAIVTNIPGTTRDTIESKINLFGLPIILVDTAGIHENSNDLVEKLGIAKSKKEIEFADLTLWISDVDEINESLEIFKKLNLSNKNIIFIINKIDKTSKQNISNFSKNEKVIKISVKKEKNLEILKKQIYEFLTQNSEVENESLVISTERQKNLISETYEFLQKAKLEKNIELIAENLHSAINSISELLGETFAPDVLDDVFHNFCIGK